MKQRAFFVSLIALIAAIAVPISAHGDDGSSRWVLQDEQGLLSADFGSSQIVYVTGVPKNVGLIPSADVYVVPNQKWSKSDGQELHDVSNPTGTPNTVIGFEVAQEPIYLPYLRVGNYDVVFDYDQNGVYNANLDDVLGVDNHPGFTVHYDGDGRSIDKTRLKNELAAPYAVAARNMAGLWGNLSVIKDATGAVHAYPLLADVGAVIAGEASTAESLVQLGADATLKFADPFAPGRTIASKGIAKAVRDLAASAAGIEADPPDPNYKKIAKPIVPPYVYDEHSADPLFSSLAAAANRAGETAAYQLALRHAMERLDGAAAANDPPYIALQAQAIADNTTALADRYQQLDIAMKRAKSVITRLGLDISLTDADRTLFTTMRTRVASSGFNVAELSDFADAGLSPTEIARFRTWIVGSKPATLKKSGTRDASALASVGPAAQLAAFDGTVQAQNLVDSLPPARSRGRT